MITGEVLRCRRPRTEGVRLVACPHGGGSATAFHPWDGLLPDDVELHAVQYPGRGDRAHHPLARDVRSLAAEAAGAVATLSDRPVAIYGHSMGALVAFHLARMLTDTGHRVVSLTVSGLPGPDVLRPTTVHSGSEDDVLAELRRLGGVPAELLDDPDLRAMILSSTRADYCLVETYELRPRERVDVPLSVHRGLDDAELTADEAVAWADVTDRPIVTHTFAGDHFHPYLDPTPVVTALVHDIAAAAGPMPPARQAYVRPVAESGDIIDTPSRTEELR